MEGSECASWCAGWHVWSWCGRVHWVRRQRRRGEVSDSGCCGLGKGVWVTGLVERVGAGTLCV